MNDEDTSSDENRDEPIIFCHSWISAYASKKLPAILNVSGSISSPTTDRRKKKPKVDSDRSLVPLHEFSAHILNCKDSKPSVTDASSPGVATVHSHNIDGVPKKKDKLCEPVCGPCDGARHAETFVAPKKPNNSTTNDILAAMQMASPVHWKALPPKVEDNVPADSNATVQTALEQPSGSTLSILGSSVNKTPSVVPLDPVHYHGMPTFVSSIASEGQRATGLCDLSLDDGPIEDVQADDLRVQICPDSYVKGIPTSPLEIRIQDRSLYSSHYMTSESRNIINSYGESAKPSRNPPSEPTPPTTSRMSTKSEGKPKRIVKVVVPRLNVGWAGKQEKQQRKLRSMFSHREKKSGRGGALPVVGCVSPTKKVGASEHSPLDASTYYMSMDGSVAIGDDGSAIQQPWEDSRSIMDYSVVKAGVKPLDNYHDVSGNSQDVHVLNDLLSSLDIIERDSPRLGCHAHNASNPGDTAQGPRAQHEHRSPCNRPIPRLMLQHKNFKEATQGLKTKKPEPLLSLTSNMVRIVCRFLRNVVQL